MVVDFEVLVKGFKLNPFTLDTTSLKNKKKLDLLLPYSVGIEVETEPNKGVDTTILADKFKKENPLVMYIHFDNYEQKIRIPTGLEGAKCLYNFCNYLFEYYSFNISSGIHYHIDFSEVEDFISEDEAKENASWMLNELDKWGYEGTYNKRRVCHDVKGAWINFRSWLKTMEIRIGNMTFDYATHITRILHAQEIAFRLKNTLKLSESQKRLVSLRAQLRELSSEEERHIISNNDANNIIKNRIVKLF